MLTEIACEILMTEWELQFMLSGRAEGNPLNAIKISKWEAGLRRFGATFGI